LLTTSSADLDQFLAQTGQRPRPDRLGQRQRPYEICDVIGKHMELETDRISGGVPSGVWLELKVA
jgi:hypothetical protein